MYRYQRHIYKYTVNIYCRDHLKSNTKLIDDTFARSFSTSVFVQQSQRKGNAVLKDKLRHYLSEHEYELGAMEAFGFIAFPKAKSLIELSENFSSSCGNWCFRWYRPSVDLETDFPIYTTVSSATMFNRGYEAIQSYINDTDLDPPASLAIEALERFIKEKGKHEMSLEHLQTIKKIPETEVASLISQHLLSQLLPYQSNYFLDRKYQEEIDSCPCGCGAAIQFGLTRQGSPHLFYGNGDIILFPSNRDLFLNTNNSTSAFFTLKYPERSGCVNDMNFDDDEDDVTRENGFDEEVDEDETVRRICKQAISLSLCKRRNVSIEASRKLNNDLVSNTSMMPVCAITKDSYEIAVYNPENDYLLYKVSDEDLKLFDSDHSLRFSAIVDLWLLIHHNLFLSYPGPKTLNHLKGTCNLIPQLGRERFNSVVDSSRWLYQAEKFGKYSVTRAQDSSEMFRVDVRVKEKKFPMKGAFSC